jgi:DNA-binding MarR family transcriptional regulator
MSYIRKLIAIIASWFKTSEPQPIESKPKKKHKKHVYLTASEKKSLYALYNTGEEPAELARAFDVSMATVYRVTAEYDRKTLRAIRKKAPAYNNGSGMDDAMSTLKMGSYR